MNIHSALLLAAKKKVSALDAEILLSFCLKKEKEFLFTHPEYELSASVLKKFRACINRRKKGEPVTYITGKKEFFKRNFFVDKNVLIPRPETEELVEQVIDYINQLPVTRYRLRVTDIGTGSGCIAITLKKELPQINVLATDISKKALLVAKKNAQTHKAKISFSQGNLLTPIKKKPIDVIVANLPYLTTTFVKQKKEASIAHEPKMALDGGPDGLQYYKILFEQISQLGKMPKAILCEIDPRQKKSFTKLCSDSLPGCRVTIKFDLSCKARFGIIKPPHARFGYARGGTNEGEKRDGSISRSS